MFDGASPGLRDGEDFIHKYYWVIILAGVFLISFIIFLVWLCRIRARRAGYEVLPNDVEVVNVSDDTLSPRNSMRMATFDHRTSTEDPSILNCQFYLRLHSNYRLNRSFSELGTRTKKKWFLIDDVRVNQTRMLTMLPRSSRCRFDFTPRMSKLVKSVLERVQHPYVLSVHHADFITNDGDSFVVMTDYSNEGSLKDLLYAKSPILPYTVKYGGRGKRLPTVKLALYGRQILEGLEYLHDIGIQCNNLHSGNVIISRGVARVSGYENTIFGVRSRLYTPVKTMVQDIAQDSEATAFDILCFGLVAYEMAVGEEILRRPNLGSLVLSTEVEDCLKFVFEHPEGRIPTLTEVKSLPIFNRIQISARPEMIQFVPSNLTMTKAMESFLDAIRRGKSMRLRSKRSIISETSFASSAPSTSRPSTSASARHTSTPTAPASAPTTPAPPRSTAQAAPTPTHAQQQPSPPPTQAQQQPSPAPVTTYAPPPPPPPLPPPLA
eukprot:m.133949 g.133949  ORF g.133949 m.133949 type:complete len:493 (-) comp13950_c0_seq5:586-2064(-)